MGVINKCLIIIVAITMISTASALPELQKIFNQKYGTSKTKLDSCQLCHIPDKPDEKSCGFCHKSYIPDRGKLLTPFGRDIQKNLNLNVDRAFSKIDVLDSDNDGISNINEIRGKSLPGDRLDRPKTENIPK